MALESIQSTASTSAITTAATTTSTNQQGNTMVQTAKDLGISVASFYVYDDEGNCTGVDYVKLQTAIREAKNSSKEAEEDEFVKVNDIKLTSDEQRIQAQGSKDTIKKEIKDKTSKYAKYFDEANNTNNKEGQLATEWSQIQQEARKLTSVTTTNTTVLEGVKEFITNLTNLVNESKTVAKDKEETENKESIISLESAEDIINKNNKIEVDETVAYLNNPFYKSAFETSKYDEEEIKA